MPFAAQLPSDPTFDLVLAGTGFASTFFLHRFLQRSGPAARVLVLEKGAVREHRSQLTEAALMERESRESFDNRTPAKPWVFRLAFGGGSNCWWACTPRMLPEDFRLASRYGVGLDWPIAYDDLEPYYCDAEALMSVSGPADLVLCPRSRPYPQPPHRFTDPDRLLKQRFPGTFFNQPTARPAVATGRRPRCCANGVCDGCPIDSKFTILNEMRALYEDDPRVTLLTGASVERLDVAAGVVTAVRYVRDGVEHAARAGLVGLGANAVFNPAILLRSGLNEGPVGRGLMEQASALVDVDLAGVDNFQGSTSITGLGYMLYAGRQRGAKAAGLLESWNVPLLRPERGRWRQRLRLKVIYEDFPQSHNAVQIDMNEARPQVTFRGHSDATERGLAALETDIAGVLDALPVERFTVRRNPHHTEAHVLGTAPMGLDASTSVVDADLVHHRVRNLLVLGGSTFPTAAPANPTLTLSALSLRAADRVTG